MNLSQYATIPDEGSAAANLLYGPGLVHGLYLLPTLVSVQRKLNALKPSLQHAGPLLDAILAGLAERFNGYSERPELIIASVTLPNFKLRWLDDIDIGKEHARSLLYSHVSSFYNDNRHISESDADSQEDDIFRFGSDK